MEDGRREERGEGNKEGVARRSPIDGAGQEEEQWQTGVSRKRRTGMDAGGAEPATRPHHVVATAKETASGERRERIRDGRRDGMFGQAMVLSAELKAERNSAGDESGARGARLAGI